MYKYKIFSPMEVGERVKTIRDRLGETQAEMAESLGIDKKTYAKYEKGNAYPKADTLAAIAYRGDTSIDYLMGKTNDSKQLYTQLDSLGLSEKSAEKMQYWKEYDPPRSACLNFIIETHHMKSVLTWIVFAVNGKFQEIKEKQSIPMGVSIISDDVEPDSEFTARERLEKAGYFILSPEQSYDHCMHMAAQEMEFALREKLKSCSLDDLSALLDRKKGASDNGND